MLLFSTAVLKHKLTFTPLSDCQEHILLAARWAEEKWGYIRNKGIEYREGVMRNCSEQIFIGTLAEQPVAMFGLFDYHFHHDLVTATNNLPRALDLMYVYVDEQYRGLGFGRQIIQEAKQLATNMGADLILLETLTPNLDAMYERQGAEIVCESRLFSCPTEVLRLQV